MEKEKKKNKVSEKARNEVKEKLEKINKLQGINELFKNTIKNAKQQRQVEKDIKDSFEKKYKGASSNNSKLLSLSHKHIKGNPHKSLKFSYNFPQNVEDRQIKESHPVVFVNEKNNDEKSDSKLQIYVDRSRPSTGTKMLGKVRPGTSSSLIKSKNHGFGHTHDCTQRPQSSPIQSLHAVPQTVSSLPELKSTSSPSKPRHIVSPSIKNKYKISYLDALYG